MPNDTLDPALAREAVEYLAGCGYQPQLKGQSDMDKIKDGGPAFPTEKWECVESLPGMSLRDWFAGQFLAGQAASHDAAVAISERSHKLGMQPHLYAARMAYAHADAMLAAREAK